MTPRCPLCRQPAASAHAPFCSARCRDRDLLQWLDGGYRFPAAVHPDEAGSDGLDKPFPAD